MWNVFIWWHWLLRTFASQCERFERPYRSWAWINRARATRLHGSDDFISLSIFWFHDAPMLHQALSCLAPGPDVMILFKREKLIWLQENCYPFQFPVRTTGTKTATCQMISAIPWLRGIPRQKKGVKMISRRKRIRMRTPVQIIQMINQVIALVSRF